MRLIVVAYFTKHRPVFQVDIPIDYFKSYFTPSCIPEEHHKQWYDGIRMHIWERITFEDQLPPSLDALKLYWLRSIWVIDYWRQAHLNKLTLLPIEWFGWEVHDGKVHIEWDSTENILKTQSSVAFLMHGCGCKKGCHTCRCKWFKVGRICGPGCQCSSQCQNKKNPAEDMIVY